MAGLYIGSSYRSIYCIACFMDSGEKSGKTGIFVEIGVTPPVLRRGGET